MKNPIKVFATSILATLAIASSAIAETIPIEIIERDDAIYLKQNGIECEFYDAPEISKTCKKMIDEVLDSGQMQRWIRENKPHNRRRLRNPEQHNS